MPATRFHGSSTSCRIVHVVSLFSLVATHADLDLETVATLSAGAADIAATVSLPAIPLATCNRLEIYAEVPSSDRSLEDCRAELLDVVAASSGLDRSLVEGSFRVLQEEDAVRHLFEVGAGLDSAVIGEREIAGQVRRSLAQARHEGSTSGNLTKLFETATRAAKDVGKRTALGSRGRSIVSVALDIAGDTRGDGEQFYRGASAVLIGTGSYAGTSLNQLVERGVKDIGVFSGSGRAEEFVAGRGAHARALRMEELSAAISSADVLIGCSGGNRRITAREIRTLAGLPAQSGTSAAAEGAAPRKLTVIDLALSHDFDPDIAEIPGVDLITLESVRIAAPTEADESVEEARAVVSDAVEGYLAHRRERTADDAIVALRRHTQEVLDAEMAKVRKHHGCTAATEEVEFAVRKIVQRLLHTPTVRARELAAEGRTDDYVSSLENLYGISVDARSSQREGPVRRRRPEEFSAAELAHMAAYLRQVPAGGFCKHHQPGDFAVDRLPAAIVALAGPEAEEPRGSASAGWASKAS
ncbi:MAG TPA: glutamyl-tRNA reductase [Candidatus Nesterenkonia stercoripullorum]|uniref:Glutamyl-tRNA reductase n=1 Tax=Candidatus Nesterenkonia stercoripullorum TaxID=2838701 RepID=A0A9D1UUE3_9MICC|nr:glutamyl-tRNA reductase [Candidatus Nesterenkonia stercoripullorum]